MGKRLRGAAGTKVKLVVVRDGNERALELERRKVTVKNVPYSFLAAPGVGYLRLAQFSQGAGSDVAATVDSLRARGARSGRPRCGPRPRRDGTHRLGTVRRRPPGQGAGGLMGSSSTSVGTVRSSPTRNPVSEPPVRATM